MTFVWFLVILFLNVACRVTLNSFNIKDCVVDINEIFRNKSTAKFRTNFSYYEKKLYSRNTIN